MLIDGNTIIDGLKTFQKLKIRKLKNVEINLGWGKRPSNLSHITLMTTYQIFIQ